MIDNFEKTIYNNRKAGGNMLKFSELCIERPLGTKGNHEVLKLLYNEFNTLKYNIIELPLNCIVWESNNSFVEQNNNKIEIFPSPFSRNLKGNFLLKYVSTFTELSNIKNYDGILIFVNELSKNSVMAKNYPFYFPDEDKLLYETFEKINPKGIITISGQDQASGLNPFPVFEDVNLEIPTAYVSSLGNITEKNEISIEINSKIYKEKSKQLIFRKEGLSKDIILIAAHMDSKYNTCGANDNAAGLYTLYETTNLIKDKKYNYTVEIVPFNGEESPEASGELAYLNYLEENSYKIKSVINIDGPGHIGSKNMFSFFNYEQDIQNEIVTINNLLEGEQWYSGDHVIFAFQNISCIAITSSDMFTDSIKLTHTKMDKEEIVDIKLLSALSKSIVNILEIINGK
ncbi:aminopeptidase [Spirochaetia bacterium]|nr:aminopeptidase [Spirochaetia bacterium]GHU30987.1 aminopeptidase [Spirochaetia bacterium]